MFFKKFVACALICGFVTDVLANLDYKDNNDYSNDNDYADDIGNEDLDYVEGSEHRESPTTEKLKNPITLGSTDFAEISLFRGVAFEPTIKLISEPNSEGYFKEGTEFKAQCFVLNGEPMWNFSKPQDQIKINDTSMIHYKIKEIQFHLTPEHNKMVIMCSQSDSPDLMDQFIINVESLHGGIQKQNVMEDVLQTNSSSKSNAGSILGMQVAIGVLVLTVLVLVVLLFVVSRATGRLSIGGSKPSETNINEQNSSAKSLRLSSN